MSKYTAAIKAYVEREEARKKREEELAKIRHINLFKKVEDMLPAVKEIIEVANECVENKINIDEFYLVTGGGIESNKKLGFRKESAFRNNTVCHNAVCELDFFMDVGNRGMVFRNSGITFYAQWGSFSGDCEVPNEEMLQFFISNFVDFENRFYSYLDEKLNSNKVL